MKQFVPHIVSFEFSGVKTTILQLPVETKSETNMRGGWRSRHFDRSKPQRKVVGLELLAVRGRIPKLPVKVTLTRLGPKELDKGNLPASLKAIEDEVARHFGIADNDPRIAFNYQQQPKSPYGVIIRIAAAAGTGEAT